MPIYEYQCANCGHQLEKLQKISDDPLTTCPECGRETLNKLVSAAGFRLKGAAWYETDFKKDGKKNLAGDDKPAKSDTSKETAGDAKPSKSTSGDSSTKASTASA